MEREDRRATFHLIVSEDPRERFELSGADHSYRTPKAAEFTPADLRGRLLDAVLTFITASAAEI